MEDILPICLELTSQITEVVGMLTRARTNCAYVTINYSCLVALMFKFNSEMVTKTEQHTVW